jgi:hypothetical protein
VAVEDERNSILHEVRAHGVPTEPDHRCFAECESGLRGVSLSERVLIAPGPKTVTTKFLGEETGAIDILRVVHEHGH